MPPSGSPGDGRLQRSRTRRPCAFPRTGGSSSRRSGLIKVSTISRPDADGVRGPGTNVHNFWDRGFWVSPWIRVPGETVRLRPRRARRRERRGRTALGHAGLLSDPCPTPPGATGTAAWSQAGCRSGCRQHDEAEEVLIEDWCQQYPSHSVGSLAFGAEGALYVSGGDGASFNFADWGQDGARQPVRRSPRRPGSILAPPTAEGGALRSQDLRTTTDPTSLDGAVLRVDPARVRDCRQPARFQRRCQRAPDRRARPANPFRIGVRPHTSEVWAAMSAGTPGRSSLHRSERERSRTSAGRATKAARANPATTPRT